MNAIKIILSGLAFLVLSAILALVATSTYYKIYKGCSGSSPGLAFSLTYFIAPISTIFIFGVGLASKRLVARYGYGQGVQVIFKLVCMLLASALVAALLLSPLYPYPRDENYGACPEWIMK